MWGLHRPPVAPEKTKANAAPAALETRASGQRRVLKQALATGTLGDVADALCAMAEPPVADVDALRARLADPAQVAAIEALQRARWAGGDGTAAREALRRAFVQGPRWHKPKKPATPLLAPLYPRPGSRPR
jgi:hypothetical protein